MQARCSREIEASHRDAPPPSQASATGDEEHAAAATALKWLLATQPPAAAAAAQEGVLARLAACVSQGGPGLGGLCQSTWSLGALLSGSADGDGAANGAARLFGARAIDGLIRAAESAAEPSRRVLTACAEMLVAEAPLCLGGGDAALLRRVVTAAFEWLRDSSEAIPAHAGPPRDHCQEWRLSPQPAIN